MHINSPIQALLKLLRSRAANNQDVASREHFHRSWQWLQQQLQDDPNPLDTGLVRFDPADAIECEVFCTDCGQQFSHMRYLLRHRTRKHPEVLKAADTPKPYASHTIDGMPACRHCYKVFKRVEGLKKHLKHVSDTSWWR